MATDSPGEEFVTIVPVGENQLATTRDPASFVTVLTLGAAAGAAKVVVRRPRGARLGLGLKFEGGSAATEKVRKLLVQSCAEDSPAANATTPWGKLIPGDEILAIDSVSVSDLTRIDCVRRLKDSDEILTLLVRHFESSDESLHKSTDTVDSTVNAKHKAETLPIQSMLPPPVPPRKLGKKNSFKDMTLMNNGVLENKNGSNDKDMCINGQSNGLNNKLSRKSSFDSHIHRQTKETLSSLKRGSPEEVRRLVRRLSDGKTMPPEAEVYIDLLSNEWERCLALADAESDDTGSSISTVVDRLSSMASSVENSIPSTPIMQHKTIDIKKVLNCIENIDSDILRDITGTAISDKHSESKPELKVSEKSDSSFHSILNESTFKPLVTEEVVPNIKKVILNDKNNNNAIGNNTSLNDYDKTEKNNLGSRNDKHTNNVPFEKPKPMPRNTKVDKSINDHLKKPLVLSERPPLVIPEPLLTPTKKNCIENWLQRSEAEMTGKGGVEEDLVPEVLPRLIDFVPKPQFKECESVATPILRPTTAPPPPPVDQREDGSGASLDTIGELDETSDSSDTQKQNSSENDVKERKSSFESSFWEDRVNKSDVEDKSLSNDETPPPTCPRQPPDGVETPSDLVEKSTPDISARLPPRLPTGWPTNRSRFSYSRKQDARSEASVKDKIAMFSNDNSISTDRIDKCGTLPSKGTTTTKKDFSRNYSDITSLDRRLTKSQDNLDDTPRNYKRHLERPEVLGALESDTIATCITKNNYTLPESKPLFYASTTTLPSLDSSFSGYHTRSSSDDSTKSSHMSNLEFLIEQRKKSMSKLRGLVIPEGNGPVTDLPVIKIKDPLKNLFLNTCQNNKKVNNIETITPKSPFCKPVDFNDSKWKTSLLTNNLPKYSPAFKRKSLQVYSPMSVSKESTPERKVAYNDIYNLNENKLTRQSYDPRSAENKSPYAQSIYSYRNYTKLENKEVLGNLKSLSNMDIKICTATEVVDSDNDSAMSSTQSSYRSSASSPLHNMDSIESDSSRISPKLSHFTSYSLIKNEIPTKSLIKEKSGEEYVKRNVSRSVSSDTTVSLSSSGGSTATSGSQASCSSLESSVPDLDKRKNGKTYCIDTINRRNILASAKCRSGRDNKLNSPVIEAKFSHDPYDARSPSPTNKPSDHLSTLTGPVSAIGNKGENRRRSKVIADSDSDSDSEVNVRQRKTDFKNTRLKRTSSNKNKQTDAVSVDQTKLDDAPKAISERIIKEINKAGLDNYTSTKTCPPPKLIQPVVPVKVVEDKPKVQAIVKPKISKKPEDITVNNTIGNESVKPTVIQSSLRESTPRVERIINPGPDSKTQTLRLRKGAAAGVGVILAGGSDCETKDVTVHRVLTDSVADKAGLKRGAKVLSINGNSMDGLTHAQTVAILKEQRSEIVIELEYENKGSTTSSTKEKPDKVESSPAQSGASVPLGGVGGAGAVVTVVLDKAGGGAGLGFGLDGGRDSPHGDKPLTVKKLFTGGAAACSGQVMVGAELVSAGGLSLAGHTRTQAWAALKALPPGPVTLVLRNPVTT